MKEIWKDIEGYEGIYQVSNTARVIGLPRKFIRKDGKSYIVKKREIKVRIGWGGYYNVALSLDGKKKTYPIHRLVAQAFIPNPLNKSQVNHIDGNKGNNNVDNLEWVTGSENVAHAFRTGLRKTVVGNHKLSEDDVRYIRKKYKNRTCYRWGKKELAKELGISTSTIDFVLKGITWKEVS